MNTNLQWCSQQIMPTPIQKTSEATRRKDKFLLLIKNRNKILQATRQNFQQIWDLWGWNQHINKPKCQNRIFKHFKLMIILIIQITGI